MSHIVSQTSLAIEIDHGEGCYLFDTKGKRYLDFIAGWCVGSIGWGHPAIAKALEQEAKRATYIAPFFEIPAWEELASILVKNAPGKRLQKVFPVTSGSEAVDMAIKIARVATNKDVILSVDDVYHGHTYGALSIGEARKRMKGSWLSGCEYVPMPGRDESTEAVLEKIEKRLRKGDVAAFISEPLWTNAGVFIPPSDFYPKVQAMCRQTGTLFVMDEVATGFGHSGELFASTLWKLEPDIMTIAKAFTGGYATMGATLVSQDAYEKSKGIPCYSTFAWLPTDLAATRANVDVILKEKLWENARAVGTHLLTSLKPLEQLPFVKEVRGQGLLIGIQIEGEKLRSDLQRELANEGLIVEIAMESLLITPALVLTKDQAKEGAGIIGNVLARI